MGSFVKIGWVEKNVNVTKLVFNIQQQKLKSFSLGASFDSLSSVNTTKNATSAGYFTEFEVKAPVNEDITYDFRSNFIPAAELAAGIADLAGRLKTVLGAVSGTTSSIFNIMDYQVWDNTEVVKINIELTFKTETNALYDVVLPTLSLCGTTAITKLATGGFAVPGMNLKNMGEATPVEGAKPTKEEVSPEQLAGTNAKFVSFESSVYKNNYMLVTEAKPTWSKISTDAGYPAYSKVQLQIQGLSPITDTELFAAVMSKEKML